MKKSISILTYASLSAALLAGAAGSAKAEQYALMVAIEDYSKVGASNLPGCMTDLDGMKSLLMSEFGFPEANIRVLSNNKATKAAFLGELDDMVSMAEPGDSVVVYYSGHGGQVPDLNDDDETEDNLDEALITYDFDPKNPDTWLLDDHLRASLSQLKTRKALVLIDACHAGTGTRGDIINKKAEFGFDDMLGRGRVDKNSMEVSKDRPESHVLIAACAPNELSAMGEYDGKLRSLFTTALINVLPGMLSTDLSDIEVALHAEMTRLHREAADRQHPQTESSTNVSLSVLIGEGAVNVAVNTQPTPVDEPNNEVPVQTPSDGLPSAFPVSVITDHRDYRPGDAMVATVVSEKPGYLRLYYVDKEGNAALIFPNHYQRNNKISGKQRIEVGGGEFPFVFRMTEPGGTELLLAAVSPEQFSDADAFDFDKENPIAQIGKVTSIRQLVDRGTKQIEVEPRPEGNGVARPVQIGRAACLYEIHDR